MATGIPVILSAQQALGKNSLLWGPFESRVQCVFVCVAAPCSDEPGKSELSGSAVLQSASLWYTGSLQFLTCLGDPGFPSRVR